MSDDSGSNETRKDPGLSYLRGLTFGKGAFLFDDADPVATTIGAMQNESSASSGSVSSGDAGSGILVLLIAIPFIFIFGSPFFEAYFITKLLPGFLDYVRVPQILGKNMMQMGIDFDLESNKYVFTSAKYYYYYIPALLFTLGFSLIRYVRGFYIFFMATIIFIATYYSRDSWFGWFIFGMIVFRLVSIYLLSRKQAIRYKYKAVKIFAPILNELVVGFGVFVVFLISVITGNHYLEQYKSHLYDGQISEHGVVLATQDGFLYPSFMLDSGTPPIGKFHKGDRLKVESAVVGENGDGYLTIQMNGGQRRKIVYARNIPGVFLPVKEKRLL